MEKVAVDQHLLELYQENNLDLEVSLSWVLGYVQMEKACRLAHLRPLPADTVLEPLPSGLVQEIRGTFPNLKLEEAVHFLAAMSLVLGGGE